MTDFAWEPTPAYIDNANVTRLMRRHGMDDFASLLTRSQEDPGWFWNAVVEDLGIEFFEPYESVLDVTNGPAWPRWFAGGKINLAHNCVDRPAQLRPDAPALVAESEDSTTRTLSFAELATEVHRVANGLEDLGVNAGDVVGVYMPMVPEAVIAAYAIASLGAIYMPVFSGFAPAAVSARLNDCEAKLLFTADGTWRRGAEVPMKRAADEAVEQSPSVRTVVMLENLGGGAPVTKR